MKNTPRNKKNLEKCTLRFFSKLHLHRIKIPATSFANPPMWLAVPGWGGYPGSHTHFCTNLCTICWSHAIALTILLNRTFWMSRHAWDARWCVLHREFRIIENENVVSSGGPKAWRCLTRPENFPSWWSNIQMWSQNRPPNFPKIPIRFFFGSEKKSIFEKW